jgi:hypothetical protein
MQVLFAKIVAHVRKTVATVPSKERHWMELMAMQDAKC